ncbi:MAG: hypothetical protein AAF628_05170 [Planctomycetota bacterium]
MTHRAFNAAPHEYLLELDVPAAPGHSCDLAIIEFDDQGALWQLDQLQSALDVIARRNKTAERGVLVVLFIHGWKNNANPTRGDLANFRLEVVRIAEQQYRRGTPHPDRVVGVYLGWRGLTSRLPIYKELTFWARRLAAERVASLNMREVLFRVMATTKQRPESKCFIVGHSMGGLVVGKTLAPSLTTLLVTHGAQGIHVPADLIVLANPALDALSSWQFIDFLKRAKARLELRAADGATRAAPGPIVVSMTSEADSATSRAYPFGRTVSALLSLAAFRRDRHHGLPSQRFLATHAEGHVDDLVSHRARVVDDEVVLERVPDAYNDTPFWIVRVTSEICRDHSDLNNERFGALVGQIGQLNHIYDAGVQTWMRCDAL